MENRSCHQVPSVTSGDGFQRNGVLWTKPLTVPEVESELCYPLKNLGISFRKARGLGPGRTVCQFNWAPGWIMYQFKLTCPVKENQLDQKLECKKSRAQSKSSSAKGPWGMLGKTENSKAFSGCHTCVSHCRQMLITSLPPNLLKSKIQLSKVENLIGSIQQSMNQAASHLVHKRVLHGILLHWEVFISRRRVGQGNY